MWSSVDSEKVNTEQEELARSKIKISLLNSGLANTGFILSCSKTCYTKKIQCTLQE